MWLIKWIFIGRTDAEAETPILWPPEMKSQLIGKDHDAGKDWRQKDKGVAKDEMVRLHHQLNGLEFDQTPGDSGRQWSAAVHGIAKSWIQLSDWTTATKWNECFEYNYQKDFLYRKHYDLNPKTHF